MFNSEIFDAAIGLVTVYFFLSLLCSVISEIFTGLTKKRARMLSEGILSLLRDPKALHKLYEQPLFMGNSTPKNIIISLLGSFRPLAFKKKTYPSYISSHSFVISLLESLKQHPDVVKKLLKDKISLLEDKLKTQYFRNKLESLPKDDKIKEELQPLLKSTEAEPARVSSAIETYYDKIVDRPAIFKEILKDIEGSIPTIDKVENIKKLVNNLPDDNVIRKALLPLLEIAGTGSDSLDKAIKDMERWYDEAMERVTGWYKRYSQAFVLVLAFVVALVLNADTFQIAKAIYRDQALRTSLIDLAEKRIKQPPSSGKGISQGEQPISSSGQEKPGKGGQGAGTTSSSTTSVKPETKKGVTPTLGSKSLPSDLEGANLMKKVEEANQVYQQISSVNLPIGWPFTEKGWPDTDKIFGSQRTEGGKEIKTPGLLSFVKVLGILLTALMVSLGSNFWFELLNKLINMRNAGKKPLTREAQDAQKK